MGMGKKYASYAIKSRLFSSVLKVSKMKRLWKYLALGQEAAWGSFLQVCTSEPPSALPDTAWWSPCCPPPAQDIHTASCLCALQTCDNRRGRRVCTRSHPGLQSVPLLYLAVQLPRVKGQLHLPEKAVVPEAVVVPHGHLQAASLQLRVADHVLRDTVARECKDN